MNKIILVLILFLCGCGPNDNDPEINAKYLALNKCKMTGETFESVDKQFIAQGRGGYWKDVTNQYYIYSCENGNQRLISTVKMKITKID